VCNPVAIDTKFKPHVCGECGGCIDLRHPDGDFLAIKRDGILVFMPVPTYLYVPKCGYCGEVFLGYTEGRKIAHILGGELT
jgi:hypothetical protein